MSWLRGSSDAAAPSRPMAGQQPPSQQGPPGGLPPRRAPAPSQAQSGGYASVPQYGASNSSLPGGYAGQQQPAPGLPPRGGQQPGQYGGHSQAGGQAGGGRFEVTATPEDSLVLRNRLIVSEADFDPRRSQYVQLRTSRGNYPLSIETHPRVAPGTVALGKDHRAWCSLRTSGDVVTVEPLNVDAETGGKSYLQSLTLEVGFYSEKAGVDTPFDAEALEEYLKQNFESNLFVLEQPVIFTFNNKTVRGIVRSLSNIDLSFGAGKQASAPQQSQVPTHFGILMSQTEVAFTKSEGSRINLKASKKRAAANAIVRPDFNFSDMGIGGLDDEFQIMFRRAFASRIFPPGLVEQLGINHVKGILLYGPPGTGKTLMARQIGKMLNAREPKIVNGPEVLNKFVGQSEENIRKLFADAEKEYKAKGDESGLHIIIFDELDAICKQRGATASSSGVGDTVVNQLLSKMDGVDQLNNILIIGMTNRKDLIDEALLRAGRLEVHVEISLPDEAGRLQILGIHTSSMRQGNLMDKDVDLKELAANTKNFSGAEIRGLVNSASSFAFTRHVKVGTSAGISEDVNQLKVNRADFQHALEEVKPLFGVSEEELAQVVQNGIMHFSPTIEDILNEGDLLIRQVRESEYSHLVSVLMHGIPGSGKTALAATIGQKSGYPFIKLISPDNMVGFSEWEKVAYINKVFNDSYKSPMSVVIVDSIERLIDWTPIGARFSNHVLQALMVLMKKRPPKNRRLLVIATTSNKPMLQEMEMTSIFDTEIRVPPIDSIAQIMAVVEDSKLYKPGEPGYRHIESTLQKAGYAEEGSLSIGVDRLLTLVDRSRQYVEDPSSKLSTAILEALRF